MSQKWHYIIKDVEGQFISNYIDSELPASVICSHLESFGWEIIILERAKQLPVFNWYTPPATLNWWSLFKAKERAYV